jgi:hypothetical protein
MQGSWVRQLNEPGQIEQEGGQIMKTRTFFLVAGTVGAGAVLTSMMRRGRHEQEAQAESKRSHRRRNMLAVLGVGALLARASRRRRLAREAHNKAQ